MTPAGSLPDPAPIMKQQLVSLCVGQLSFSRHTIPDAHNLKKERFILTHDFSGFSPWLSDSEAEIAHWKGPRRGKMLNSQQSGSRVQEDPGERYSASSKDMCPVTDPFQWVLPPNNAFSYELTSESVL